MESEGEKPDKTIEKVKTPKRPGDKTLKEQGKTAQGQWQVAPVYAAVTAINPDQKGGRANDESMPRAQGGADDFLNISKGWIIAPPTVTIVVGDRIEQHTKYFGELFVSA